MGQAIERLAKENNHQIAFINYKRTVPDAELIRSSDVCIEFTGPESAFDNIKACIDAQVPVVSGTTGWLNRREELELYCKENNGSFFYASNFSVGVNIFFTLNKQLARIMNNFKQYAVNLEEIHHTQKKDAPSGTAITLLDGIIENSSKTSWDIGYDVTEDSIPVTVKRIDPSPGTHSISYSSMIDQIELKHTAHSRDGFALGAISAAKWIKGKHGVFGMSDMLTF